MTVAELIAYLQQFPADMPVMNAYNSGYTAVAAGEVVKVFRTQYGFEAWSEYAEKRGDYINRPKDNLVDALELGIGH